MKAKRIARKTCAAILSAALFVSAAFSLTACGKKNKDNTPEDGKTPFIGTNGNWWIGETDTGVCAVGKNGRDGVDGNAGADAIAPQFSYDTESGDILISYDSGRSWSPLANVGSMVADGKDGISISSCEINSLGELIVTYSSGESDNLGVIVAEPGSDGVGIADAYVDDDGSLTLTLTDGRVLPLGKVIGKDGIDGVNGTNGTNGVNGVTPRLKIDTDSLEWCVSYDGGVTWESLGVIATGTDGTDGTNGTNGVNGVTPRLKIDTDSLEWCVSYDGGMTWESLGVIATGTDGTDGTNGTNGVNGVTPRLKIDTDSLEWCVSYDGGVTWESLGVIATGADGTDGTNGTNGVNGVTPRLKIDTDSLEWCVSYDGGVTWESLGVIATGTDGTDGTNGTNGTDGVTPQLKINSETEEWEVSYDGGKTWESLGVLATGESGSDGISPQIRIHGGYWQVSYNKGIEWHDTGVKAEGTDGDDGRGIAKLEIVDGYLYVTYTDSQTPVKVGKVSGDTASELAPVDVYTDALAFYPLGDGSEYGVKIGNAIYMKTIVIPATYNGKPVTTILERGFSPYDEMESCLEEVVIPESITEIQADAFDNCTKLTRVYVPASVTTIGEMAFFSVLVVEFERTEAPEGETWETGTLGCNYIEWGISKE